ncbi:MAG: outer membrane beta-barrel protein [Saprospiraceae bacterium]|nr:PorT family protein [Saprospiraceae bacterium]MDW8229964.1 outer membrane beta-barrel protein [Saprospiraceae bacterium]
MQTFFSKKIGLIAFAAVLGGSIAPAWGQLRTSFKVGLNAARIAGPSETDANGNNLETWRNVTGFHLGMGLGYSFTDAFGLRGELIYSRRGAKYTFDGPSYRLFRHSAGFTEARGDSRYFINLQNVYIDLPVLAYARWKDLEFSAGVYGGLLVQSIGEGSLIFTGGRTVPLGNTVPDLEFNLQHNYRKDKISGGDFGEKVNVQVDGRQVELPKTMGAYFDHPEGSGKLYKALDYGLVGGVSYYMSRSLFFGVRFQYGLADITNEAGDLAKSQTNNGQQVFRNDHDHNILWQFSIGFGF